MARLLSALVAVALVGGWAVADDKKPADEKKADAPTGVWTKKTDEGLTLDLDFTKKDVLVVTAKVEDRKLIITTKLTAGKDGRWTAKATKIENKNDFPVTPKDDYEFSFKLTVEKATAKVSDFTANENQEESKPAVEGEYEKKGDK
jgi:hypothetical protein